MTAIENKILALLADELDAARAQLEALGLALIGDPAVSRPYMLQLQALDHIGQRCASIAEILRADDRQAAAIDATLESIADRASVLGRTH